MLSQRYSGDITIVPDISYWDYLSVMSNPTSVSIVRAKLRGERATWPSKRLVDIHRLIQGLDTIHNHCTIELAIDNTLHDLNVKMAFGNSPIQQRDARRKSTPTPEHLGLSMPRHHSISMGITPLDKASPFIPRYA
jgi:TAG lipase / steryl ester hydrolase / phospholipase A2 / LPA acyltransferase